MVSFSKRRGLLAFSILLLCFATCLWGCVGYVTEESILTPSHATILDADSIGSFGNRKLNLDLAVAPYLRLRGYEIIPKEYDRTMLYFGGNGAILADLRPFLDTLAVTYDARVISFDWRGYGFSDGSPHLRAIMEDAPKIFDDVVKLSGSAPIVIGRSLGSGVATYLASIRAPAALILISPVSDLTTVIEGWSRFSPWYLRPFVRVRPDDSLRALHPQPIEVASKIHCPVLIIHGDEDRVIPISSGRQLYDSLVHAQTRRFVRVEDGTHSNINLLGGAVRDSIQVFLNSVRNH